MEEEYSKNLHMLRVEEKVTITDALAEWDYGAYEGLVTSEIRKGRKARGLDKEREWDIWRDGCEGGEGAGEVTERLDGLVRRIREMQGPWMQGGRGADVLLVCIFVFFFNREIPSIHIINLLARCGEWVHPFSSFL